VFFYAVIALSCALPLDAARPIAVAAWLGAIVVAMSPPR
jgi:hypothetical protein